MMYLVALAVLSTLAVEDPLEEFFADFAKKRDGMRVVEARFVQKNITPDEVSSSAGTIVYVRPRRIVFRYEDPEIVHLVDGLRMYEYDAELKQVIIYDLEDDPQTEALFLSFDDDTKRLREAYAVSFFEPGKEGAKGLLLVPKPKNNEIPFFERARLHLRAKDYLPYLVEIVNDEESRVIIKVEDLKVNGDLEPRKVQIAVPEGTKVIENDVPIETVGPGGKWLPEQALPQKRPAAESSGEEVAAP